MLQNVLLFIHLKNVQDWLYVEHYLLQQTMLSLNLRRKKNHQIFLVTYCSIKE